MKIVKVRGYVCKNFIFVNVKLQQWGFYQQFLRNLQTNSFHATFYRMKKIQGILAFILQGVSENPFTR